MDFREDLVQMIETSTLHMPKFKRYNKCGQIVDVVQFIAILDYFTLDTLQLTNVAGLVESLKMSKTQGIEL
jgi:hypothetical protein